MTPRLVTFGSALAVTGAVHAAVNARLLRRPVLGETTGRTVAVLIPARDEAATISDCLTAVRDQAVAEIVVLDDGSSDATATIARAVAADDPRVRIVTGRPLPPGWLGKPHACAQAAAHVGDGVDVLVFVDADVRLRPGAVAAAVALLDRLGLDAVSPYPRQIAVTVAERLTQPLLQWSWLTFVPLRVAERSSRPALAAGNGQFFVLTRAAYERCGGHAAIRGAVLDDIALARSVVASGGRVAVVDGTALAECRMYDGWAAVRDGYGKSLWSAFGSPVGAAAVIGLLGLVHVVPAVAAVRGSRIGLAGYVAGVGGRVISARTTGGRAWPDALAHPASVVVLGYLTGSSVVRHIRGTLTWKGRTV